MTKKTGGIWGFIKRLFGFGNGYRDPFSYKAASDEEIDAELNEPFKYDEAKTRREAEEMIAKSFEDEKTTPENADVFFQRATGYSILGDNEKSLEVLDKILSIDADYTDAYRLKASIYDDLENYEEVVNNLDRAISLHVEQKEIVDSDGVFERIDNLLSRIETGEMTDDYQNRGAAHYRLKNFEAAIGDYTKAIEIDPDNDYLYSNRGEAYLEAGNHAKALEDLNKAIEIEENEYNFATRAGIYRQTGNYDAALRDISKSITLNDAGDQEIAQFFRRRSERAEIYMEKGDYDSAIRDYTVEIEKDPAYFEAYERRAAAYRSLNMESLAEADEQKAAEIVAELEASEKSS